MWGRWLELWVCGGLLDYGVVGDGLLRCHLMWPVTWMGLIYVLAHRDLLVGLRWCLLLSVLLLAGLVRCIERIVLWPISVPHWKMCGICLVLAIGQWLFQLASSGGLKRDAGVESFRKEEISSVAGFHSSQEVVVFHTRLKVCINFWISCGDRVVLVMEFEHSIPTWIMVFHFIVLYVYHIVSLYYKLLICLIDG